MMSTYIFSIEAIAYVAYGEMEEEWDWTRWDKVAPKLNMTWMKLLGEQSVEWTNEKRNYLQLEIFEGTRKTNYLCDINIIVEGGELYGDM